MFGNVVRETDKDVLRGFCILFCLLQAFARFLYGVSLIFFNVHGKFKAQMLEDLEQRRREKVESMNEEGAQPAENNGSADE